MFSAVPTARAAAETPPDRDRVVDGVRAAALLVVVAGHVVMAVVAWPDGVPLLGNLLAAYPWTQALTWVLQIMPLFFFGGGAANALSWDRHQARGGDYATWLWGRGRRLLRPAWIYLAVLSAIAVVVTLLAPSRVAEPLMLLTTQLLWFLGAYLIVTAMAPLFRRTTLRGGAVGLGLLLSLVALVDLARFAWGLPEALGLLNFVLVWAIPAYAGSLRAHGTLARLPWPATCLAVVVGFAVNAVLIRYAVYPVSMVGMPGEPVSNMAPPTLVLAIHSVVLACLVTLLDRPIARLLQRQAVWRRVVGVNLVAMTLYLWHLPVLIGVTALGHSLHLDRPVRLGADGYPVPDGWGYLLGSIAFVAVYAAGVWAVVRLLWPLEHAPLPWWDSPLRSRAPGWRTGAVLAAAATAGVGIATLVLSATGLAGFPTRITWYAGIPLTASAAIALMVGSGLLLRWAGGERR